MIAEKLSTEEKQQALERASRSQTFARSDRLRGLLQFICGAEMEGRQDSLNEHVIGVEALGRPEGYSPSEDSSVRSRVYELRQRLEKFYATEAPDADLRIDLPKGSYVPKYVRAANSSVGGSDAVPVGHAVSHAAVCQAEPEPQAPAPVSLAAVWTQHWRVAAAFLAGAAMMYVLLVLRDGSMGAARATSLEPSAQWTADLESIWRPFLDPSTPVLISFQSRLFLSTGPLVVRDPRIDSYPAIDSSEPIMRTKNLFGVPQLYENRNYTDFGSASACLLLGKLLGGRQPNLRAKRSTEVNWEDLGKNNVIVLGKPNADPDIARLLPREHFVVDGATIRNLRPQAGEMSEWTDNGTPWDRSNNWTQKYGLVTMIPSPQPRRWILSMAGSGSEHLWGLAQFLTSAEPARQLVAKLRNSNGEISPSWQAVVRLDFKSQSPVKVEYVTHRILTGATPTSR